MRITLKLAVLFSLAILIVLSLNAAVQVRRELRLFEVELPRAQRLLGQTVADAAARVWARAGEAEAIDVVEDANLREPDVQLRWVRLDARPGDPVAPALPPADVARLEERPLTRAWAPPGGEEALYTLVRVPGRPAAIELRGSLAEERTYLRATLLQAAAETVVLVAACGALAWLLGAALIGRPVRALGDAARRIGEGDLAAPVPPGRRDELGRLGAAMEAMRQRLAEARGRLAEETEARLAAVEQLRHADRLATVGKLAAGIAHEVGTPLNVITGHAQLIADDHPADSFATENAQIIAAQAGRVADIIRALLSFARPHRPALVAQPLAPVVERTVALLEPLAAKRRVALAVRADPAVRGEVDAGQVQQVVTNLVVNALHASAAGGLVEVTVTRREATAPADRGGGAARWACVEVADRGAGIAPDVLLRIFDPFFTTKDVGEGTGLGLAVAYGIVKEHGGWIDVRSAPGEGSRFAVHLPLPAGGAAEGPRSGA